MTSTAYEQKFLIPVKDMMMSSRETAVNYMMPLGFHHIFGGSHYGPGPWENSIRRPDWSPIFYHKADKDGVGFDRTRNGSANVDQYHEPLASQFNSLETCPEIFFFGSIIFHGTINFLQVENFGTRYACIMTKVSRKLRDTKRHGQSSSLCQ